MEDGRGVGGRGRFRRCAALRCAWARGRGGCVELVFGERWSKVEVRERIGEERRGEDAVRKGGLACQSEIGRLPRCVLVQCFKSVVERGSSMQNCRLRR